MGRGLPFVIVGFTFLGVALTQSLTDDTSSAVVWFPIGIAMLAVGIGLSWRGGDDADADGESADTEQL
ncbi:hypothetical protein SAMN04487950_3230 [Halogranum rubrum]|uniref:Uncharacterized protein n=1 Tax=Halogranum rubrum TaxID=553466 RepID=A0A1I4GG46_9EURY|nr:hypothetical protein [Halogranum rubrum]SFL28257.1 hypothetical protein SAMN04487950_3230 [Halogranum rubrum]